MLLYKPLMSLHLQSCLLINKSQNKIVFISPKYNFKRVYKAAQIKKKPVKILISCCDSWGQCISE